MPAPKSSKTSKPRSVGPSGLKRAYLFLYNTVNFLAWSFCVVYTATLLHPALPKNLHTIFPQTFTPYLLATQSLAALEIFHSLVRLVRAPLITTAMQVASRLLLVWGVMFPYGGDIVGGKTTQLGDYAYLGCVGAWGITEMIRYGYFAITLSGNEVPKWWTWLRYNTFYVLYPIGISSECALLLLSLEPVGDFSPVLFCGYVAVLAAYPPGSYILYTHMMAQRRKAFQGKQHTE